MLPNGQLNPDTSQMWFGFLLNLLFQEFSFPIGNLEDILCLCQEAPNLCSQSLRWMTWDHWVAGRHWNKTGTFSLPVPLNDSNSKSSFDCHSLQLPNSHSHFQQRWASLSKSLSLIIQALSWSFDSTRMRFKPEAKNLA